MNRPTIALALLSAAFTANAEIDLTPAASEYVAEGIKHQELTFIQDKQRIQYEPPVGWNYNGASTQLHLTPPQKKFAEANITAVPLTKPQSFDETTVKLLEQQFLASLPAGSQLAKVEEEVANPVLLDGNPSFEIIVSYQSMGEKLIKSALYVNLRDTQIVFYLTTRKDDFQSLHREFKASLFSWHRVETKQIAPEAPKDTEKSSVQ